MRVLNQTAVPASGHSVCYEVQGLSAILCSRYCFVCFLCTDTSGQYSVEVDMTYTGKCSAYDVTLVLALQLR